MMMLMLLYRHVGLWAIFAVIMVGTVIASYSMSETRMAKCILVCYLMNHDDADVVILTCGA